MKGRKRRLCIYGGTDIGPALQAFLRVLTREVIEGLPCLIVSGGVKRNKNVRSSKRKPVDMVVLEAARELAAGSQARLKSMLQVWVPDRSTRPHIQRISPADGVKVVTIRGNTDLGRRIKLVREVDLLLTAKGQTQTETVLELALEANRPALPLPFSGGDSEIFWKRYNSQIRRWFPALDQQRSAELERFRPGRSSRANLAMSRLIVEVLASARFSCLVLEPYSAESNKRYRDVIRRAVRPLMVPIRLDRKASDKPIGENLAEELRKCVAIIADVTENNPSVMYEIGYARAQGIAPFLYSRKPVQKRRLPVYLTAQSVMFVKDDRELRDCIRRYLRETMKRSGS